MMGVIDSGVSSSEHLSGDTVAVQGPARYVDEGPRNVCRISELVVDCSCGVHDGMADLAVGAGDQGALVLARLYIFYVEVDSDPEVHTRPPLFSRRMEKGAQSMLQLEPFRTWNLDMRSSSVYLAARRDGGFRRILQHFSHSVHLDVECQWRRRRESSQALGH